MVPQEGGGRRASRTQALRGPSHTPAPEAFHSSTGAQEEIVQMAQLGSHAHLAARELDGHHSGASVPVESRHSGAQQWGAVTAPRERCPRVERLRSHVSRDTAADNPRVTVTLVGLRYLEGSCSKARQRGRPAVEAVLGLESGVQGACGSLPGERPSPRAFPLTAETLAVLPSESSGAVEREQ